MSATPPPLSETGERRLVIYGQPYCTHARLLRAKLEERRVAFEWRDITQSETPHREELRALANGNLSVPTVVFPDGAVLIEPSVGQVLRKLGRQTGGILGWLRSLFVP